jgi:hypothetical protein
MKIGNLCNLHSLAITNITKTGMDREKSNIGCRSRRYGGCHRGRRARSSQGPWVWSGLAGGLIAGAVIGGIASNAYGYGPGYGYYGGYGPGEGCGPAMSNHGSLGCAFAPGAWWPVARMTRTLSRLRRARPRGKSPGPGANACKGMGFAMMSKGDCVAAKGKFKPA